MRLFLFLLIAAVIGSFFIGCQESTTIPSKDVTGRTNLEPVSARTDYLLYGVNSNSDGLFTLDPETGETTFIGPLDPDPDVYTTPTAMAVRPCDGTIFVWDNSARSLLTVDQCTGIGTRVDTTLDQEPVVMWALAFSPDGRLFGMGIEQPTPFDLALVELDPTSGEVTLVGNIGLSITTAEIHPVTGVLYAAELEHRFGTINTATGEFTEIGTIEMSGGVNKVHAIAFDPTGTTLYGTASGLPRVFEIDIATADVSNVVFIPDFQHTPEGMGFAPACGQDGGDCAQPELTLVIKPGGCPNPLNPGSKGVLPMALLGGASTDIDDIDVASIAINGVAPLRSSHEDVGGPPDEGAEECDCAEGDDDGIPDLTLKFSTQAIVATLGSLTRGDNVALTLTGRLNDGSSFEVSDCVVIVGK